MNDESLSPDQVNSLRLRAQHLHGRGSRGSADVAQLLREICGVQAQDAFAASLAVWVRGEGLQHSHVENALVRDRSLVRTWCMRGTLHLLAAEDIGWLLPLLGPVFVRKSRRRYVELGLNEEIYRRAVRAICDILGGQGPLTRSELSRQLSGRGIPTRGQIIYHLLRRAGLEGIICYGPESEGEPTYVLLQDWVPIDTAMERETACAELVRRYLGAYGPARPEDLAAWSGIPVGEARAGFRMVVDELLELDMGRSRSWILKSRAAWLDELQEERTVVRLLPSFDPYLLGYRRRDLIVPRRYAKRIHPGGGVIRPTLLVGGRAAGTWKQAKSGDDLVVEVEPFNPIDEEVVDALVDEVHDLGRFLGVDAAVQMA